MNKIQFNKQQILSIYLFYTYKCIFVVVVGAFFDFGLHVFTNFNHRMDQARQKCRNEYKPEQMKRFFFQKNRESKTLNSIEHQ